MEMYEETGRSYPPEGRGKNEAFFDKNTGAGPDSFCDADSTEL